MGIQKYKCKKGALQNTKRKEKFYGKFFKKINFKMDLRNYYSLKKGIYFYCRLHQPLMTFASKITFSLYKLKIKRPKLMKILRI
jgi:hypothetical protein